MQRETRAEWAVQQQLVSTEDPLHKIAALLPLHQQRETKCAKARPPGAAEPRTRKPLQNRRTTLFARRQVRHYTSSRPGEDNTDVFVFSTDVTGQRVPPISALIECIFFAITRDTQIR